MVETSNLLMNRCFIPQDHQLYGEMVEVLLETYLNDMGMTQQQFLEACSSDLTSFGQRRGVDVDSLFDQIRAATDFQVFKVKI